MALIAMLREGIVPDIYNISGVSGFNSNQTNPFLLLKPKTRKDTANVNGKSLRNSSPNIFWLSPCRKLGTASVRPEPLLSILRALIIRPLCSIGVYRVCPYLRAFGRVASMQLDSVQDKITAYGKWTAENCCDSNQ